MKILLDNGHGIDTIGKCAPDHSFYEWEWNRKFVAILEEKLTAVGIPVHILVPEKKDISLGERCRRANAIAKREGIRNTLLISIHVDAAPSNGEMWRTARGFSARTALRPSLASMKFALSMQQRMVLAGFRGNRSIPSEGFFRQNLAICRETIMPAVLCENLFMTNPLDLAILNDELALQKMASVYVAAVQDYIRNKVYLC